MSLLEDTPEQKADRIARLNRAMETDNEYLTIGVVLYEGPPNISELDDEPRYVHSITSGHFFSFSENEKYFEFRDGFISSGTPMGMIPKASFKEKLMKLLKGRIDYEKKTLEKRKTGVKKTDHVEKTDDVKKTDDSDSDDDNEDDDEPFLMQSITLHVLYSWDPMLYFTGLEYDWITADYIVHRNADDTQFELEFVPWRYSSPPKEPYFDVLAKIDELPTMRKKSKKEDDKQSYTEILV